MSGKAERIVRTESRLRINVPNN